MTTPGTPTPAGELVDAPALYYEQLTERQRQGKSCCWCAGTADQRFPVLMLLATGAQLFARTPCAGMYGVQEVAS
ncbi:hypothetical protein [Streptomyces cyaneus]|uniref:hypothetical protein n=1 Tax=Streptomyces cyaneus TaxID=1904 RepID=UPI000FF8919B|nr:hypothetical protein [Streptomyces cyaneus]